MARHHRILVALALAACSGDEGTEPAAPPDTQRDTLVIGLSADAKNLLGPFQQSAADQILGELYSAQLVGTEFACAVKPSPGLVRSWSFSEDGRTLSMELRDDAKWQDGTPVTPEDLAFTFDLLGDPEVASARRNFAESLVDGARPRILDRTHVAWEFKHAFDQMTMLSWVTAVPFVPKHVLAAPGVDRASLRGHALNTSAPLSSGLWKLETWEKNARLVFVPNENYGGPSSDLPKLRRIVFKVLPVYSTRLLELENGAIDLLEQVQVTDADRLARTRSNLRFQRRGWRSLDNVIWNTGGAVTPHPLFGDREVRRALTAAIDTDRLIRDLLTSQTTGEVYGRPAVGTISPALCGVHNDGIQRIPFDASAARARLDELGWRDTNNDGVRDKGGDEFRFVALTNSGNARRSKAATIVQANLKDVGIDMQIEALEQGAFVERLRSRQFDAAVSGWSAALFVDQTAWRSDHENNFAGYASPKVDALIAQALAEPDGEKSTPIYREIQAEIYADQPWSFLYWLDEIVAVDKRFQDTTIDLVAPYRNLHEWWVAADQVKYPE